MPSKLAFITIDVNDMAEAVRFWCAVFGAEPGDVNTGFYSLEVPDSSVNVFLQLVPEPKTSKSRMHLDLKANDVDSEVERIAGLGATIIRPLPAEGFRFAVLADPFGNEFCVLPN